MKKVAIFSAAIIFALTSCTKSINFTDLQEWNTGQLPGNWSLEALKLADGTVLTPQNTPALSDDGIRFVVAGEGNAGIRYQGDKLYWDTTYVPRFIVFSWALDQHESNTFYIWSGIGFEHRLTPETKKNVFHISYNDTHDVIKLSVVGDAAFMEYTYRRKSD